jgi:hypothetical protein
VVCRHCDDDDGGGGDDGDDGDDDGGDDGDDGDDDDDTRLNKINIKAILHTKNTRIGHIIQENKSVIRVIERKHYN